MADNLLKRYIGARTRMTLGANEDGATAVEYGMMVSLVAALLGATVLLIGQKLIPGFVSMNDQLPAAP